VDEVIEDHQYGFRRNTSTTVHLLIDFGKAYDSVSRVVLCNILIEFDVHMALFSLVKMC